MSTALTAGVSGMQAHQRMLDVAGNNLANVNTTAYKASSVNFSELFSQTVANASSPTSTTGGTNPQQVGSGVGIASISRNNGQGNITPTGNPLDVAIDGEGYFILNNGESNVYTRMGTFSVDANSNLVETSTGYLVQRIGETGESDNFQTAGVGSISIPNDKAVEPNATSSVTLSGNLSSDQALSSVQTQVITSNTTFLLASDGTTKASSTTALSALKGYNSGTFSNADFSISFVDNDGTETNTTFETISGGYATASTTIGDIITVLNNSGVLGSEATAELSNGQIKITDATSGYSLMDLSMSFSNSGTATFDTGTIPAFFEYTTVGATEAKDVNISVFDHQGTKYNMTAAFVRSTTSNQWDFVLTSLTGPDSAPVTSISIDGRRVRGITFNEDTGAYNGLNSTIADTATFAINFGASTGAQSIALDFGTAGQFVGLTQVAGSSTAVATEQDGYAKGDLSSITVDSTGNLVGTFTNGIRKNIATLSMAMFSNSQGLEAAGKGFFVASGNSGEATAVEAQTQGAGKIVGSSLEKSNADVATEFVNLIQAQNGYQANARTIRVANDILRELSNLVR